VYAKTLDNGSAWQRGPTTREHSIAIGECLNPRRMGAMLRSEWGDGGMSSSINLGSVARGQSRVHPNVPRPTLCNEGERK
jgi:hypothetical protein